MPNPKGNPAIKKHQFQPGNPGGPGRPRKRPITEAYDDLVRDQCPEPVRLQMKLKKGATWADCIAVGQMRKAVQGDVPAAKEIREAIEGKATQRIELTSPADRGFEVVVSFEQAAIPVRERVREIVVESATEAITEAIITNTLDEK